MMTTRTSVLTFAALLVLSMAVMWGHAQSEKGDRKPVEVPPAPSTDMEKDANVTNPPYGYVTPLGSFDLKDGGAFQYLRGSTFDVELKATMYKDDGFYYYFYENNFPSWRWAFTKKQYNNHYWVFYTQGTGKWHQFSNSGLRGFR